MKKKKIYNISKSMVFNEIQNSFTAQLTIQQKQNTKPNMKPKKQTHLNVYIQTKQTQIKRKLY